MTDPAGAAEFDAALREALDSALLLRTEAETLSHSIDAETPSIIRATSRRFEGQVTRARTGFERLLGVLRNANHHTLESAYQALVAVPGRELDARRMQDLIETFRQTQEVMARSEKRISHVLRELREAGAPEDAKTASGGSGFHAEA